MKTLTHLISAYDIALSTTIVVKSIVQNNENIQNPLVPAMGQERGTG